MLPDFLLLGAAKSGTISLYHYLGQHPQLYMHPVNENSFLGLDGADFERKFRGPVDRTYIDAHCITELVTYQAGFVAAQSHQLLGDASPLYLYSEHAFNRIRHYVPHVKLIVILRQPADRAFSNYAHFRRAGIEPISDFAEALAAEAQRMAEGWGPWPFWHYRQMGFYASQLTRYYQRFSANQIFVCLFDDLVADPDKLLRRMYGFLGVDESYQPNLSVRHNIGAQPRNHTLHRLMVQPNRLKSAFNILLPEPVRHKFRDRLHSLNSGRTTVDHALHKQLTSSYREDIDALQLLIDRDLSHWLEM